MYNTDKYVLISIYISISKVDGSKVLYRIQREIHLINSLKAHILLENNVIDPEKIILDIT